MNPDCQNDPRCCLSRTTQPHNLSNYLEVWIRKLLNENRMLPKVTNAPFHKKGPGQEHCRKCQSNSTPWAQKEMTGKPVKYLSYFIWKHRSNSKSFCICNDSIITCTHSKELHRLSDLFSDWSHVSGWSSAIPDAPFHDRSWEEGSQEAEIKHKWEIRGRQAHYGRISLAKLQDEAVLAVTLLSEVCSWFGWKDNSAGCLQSTAPKFSYFPSDSPLSRLSVLVPLSCWVWAAVLVAGVIGGGEGADPPRAFTLDQIFWSTENRCLLSETEFRWQEKMPFFSLSNPKKTLFFPSAGKIQCKRKVVGYSL